MMKSYFWASCRTQSTPICI